MLSADSPPKADRRSIGGLAACPTRDRATHLSMLYVIRESAHTACVCDNSVRFIPQPVDESELEEAPAFVFRRRDACLLLGDADRPIPYVASSGVAHPGARRDRGKSAEEPFSLRAPCGGDVRVAVARFRQHLGVVDARELEELHRSV